MKVSAVVMPPIRKSGFSWKAAMSDMNLWSGQGLIHMLYVWIDDFEFSKTVGEMQSEGFGAFRVMHDGTAALPTAHSWSVKPWLCATKLSCDFKCRPRIFI